MQTIVKSVKLRAQGHKSIINCIRKPSWFARVILGKPITNEFYLGHKTVWERIPDMKPCDKQFSQLLHDTERRWTLAKDLGAIK